MGFALNVPLALNIAQIVHILLLWVVKKKNSNVFSVKVVYMEFIEYGKVVENVILVMDLYLIAFNVIMKTEQIKPYVINVWTIIM